MCTLSKCKISYTMKKEKFTYDEDADMHIKPRSWNRESKTEKTRGGCGKTERREEREERRREKREEERREKKREERRREKREGWIGDTPNMQNVHGIDIHVKIVSLARYW